MFCEHRRIGIIYVLFFMLFIFLGCSSISEKRAILSFERKVELSKIILVGKALEVENRFIGQDVVWLEPVKLIKGDLPNHDKIKVKYGDFFLKDEIHRKRFAPGKSYVLFLIPDDDFSFRMIGRFQGYFPISDVNLVCDDNGKQVALDTFLSAIMNVLK